MGRGRLFRITTFGESHGPAIGVVIEGCPPGLALDLGRVEAALARRRPGQSALTTQRKEADEPRVLSGLHEGRTLGTPIAMLIENADTRSQDYEAMRELYRPSHADYTYDAKYGLRDHRGGGRASARETAARVAAGAVALQVLEIAMPIEILAWVEQIGGVRATLPAEVRAVDVESSPVRCPDPSASVAMEALIREVKKAGDTVGGIVGAVARGVPAGLGEPVFDKLEAELAKAMLSLPAAKGFESGAGFASVAMRGSTHNDPFIATGDGIRTSSNHSGGIQGGISNGMPITLRVAFKPVATIFTPQDTVDRAGRPAKLTARGRHDPCVVPRAVPIVEAELALVLCDHWLRQRSIAPR